MAGRGPDFIIPGASKSGTTSLYHYLSEHESISIPDTKELHFFERDDEYERGPSYYESSLSTESHELAGDVTPTYFSHGIVYEEEGHYTYYWDRENDAPSRIYETYPDVKLVFTLRNPVTRAYSQYQKNYRQGRERAESFEAAIQAELEGERHYTSNPSCWIYRNRYPTHVGRWLELFERDQMMFLVFEEWIQNPEDTLNGICDFLGIEPRDSWSSTDKKKNVGGQPRFVSFNRFYQDYIQSTVLGSLLRKSKVTHVFDSLNSREGYPEMSPKARSMLSREFREEITELESMTGLDLDIWREELSPSSELNQN